MEYKNGGLEYVSLVNPETKEDVAQKLVSSGFLLAERRREKRLAKIVSDYMKAQEKAKTSRVSVWWERPSWDMSAHSGSQWFDWNYCGIVI